MLSPTLRPLALLATASLAGLASPAALACSTCKCGDYTLTLLGSEKSFTQRLRVGLDYITRSESAGAGDEREKTDEWRTLLSVAYSVNDNLSLLVQVPQVRKRITSQTLERLDASGLGDIDLVGRYVLYRSGGGSGRHLAGLRAGVRLPTADEVKNNGEKLDIDVQPDAGATAPNGGGWYSYFRYPWFVSSSLTYFHFSEAHQDFEPGDSITGSLLGQFAINQNLAVQLGVDARQAQRNHFSGVVDRDSGGFLAVGSAGISLRALDELQVNASVQLPAIDELHGAQDEDATVRVGLTYDF